jgi:UDPglucose 6-dehydrogenase
VRYALEPEYSANREMIRGCGIVFIAVPTPTTPGGFDASIVRSALSLVGKGNVAVIKSTIVPGTTARLQAEYPDIVVLYSPEFLSEATAAHDAANPFSNIIGLAAESDRHRMAAEQVLAVLPKAPFEHVCASTEAELAKYAHNLNGFFQIQLSNILYDAAQALGASWQNIEPAIAADPYISNRYSKPVHKTGRGAGGGCFIKDFAAFRETYAALVPRDARGLEMLAALERKNIDLLKNSGKNLQHLRDVYGEGV